MEYFLKHKPQKQGVSALKNTQITYTIEVNKEIMLYQLLVL